MYNVYSTRAAISNHTTHDFMYVYIYLVDTLVVLLPLQHKEWHRRSFRRVNVFRMKGRDGHLFLQVGQVAKHRFDFRSKLFEARGSRTQKMRHDQVLSLDSAVCFAQHGNVGKREFVRLIHVRCTGLGKGSLFGSLGVILDHPLLRHVERRDGTELLNSTANGVVKHIVKRRLGIFLVGGMIQVRGSSKRASSF
jgi:hypothetical protein